MRQIIILTFLLSINSISGSAQNLKDTLTVNTNSIIFFSITQSEFDELSAADTEGEINEVISDFDYYVSELLPILRKDSTKTVIYTSHQYYRIINKANIIFNRLEQPKNIVGMILNGNERHEICWGVGTDVDLMLTIQAFFKKELGNQ